MFQIHTKSYITLNYKSIQTAGFSTLWPPVVSYEENRKEEKNFTFKVKNLKTSLDIWRYIYLSLFGRCLINKCLGIPNLVHSTDTC